ncbi:MAG: TonB-dependent receptor, partial [Chitinophagaceae bacterium]|nr:TonB-dependent receptor [Chitinophagaceae bacterium]
GPANRFANFYSAGLGWIFSNTSLLKENGILTFGKLRMSYGVTGNDQIGDYNYFDLYSPMSTAYQGQVPFQPVQLFNPDFSWEKVYKWEAGIDLSLFNSLQLSVRHYRNHTDNQLLRYALPPSTGFDVILRNLPARVQNTGWEIEANATVIDRPDWNWTTSFNLTIPRNKLVRFDGLASSTYANTFVIGQPLSIVKAYGFKGVDPQTGLYTYEDVNRDGRISSPADLQSVVFTGQQLFGGLENSFRWKKLSFSFVCQFVQQKNAPSYFTRFNRPGLLANQPVDVLNRWQNPGDLTSIQKISANNSGAVTAFNSLRQSTGGYSDASFIRLRTAYISYDLLLPRLARAGLTSLLFFIQGQNLLTLTNYASLDPETKSFMPPIKMLTAGLQVGL